MLCMVRKLESNITTLMTDGGNWIIQNSPNEVVSILALLGVIYIIMMLSQTASQTIRVISYIFAWCIYLPAEWIYNKFKKGEGK